MTVVEKIHHYQRNIEKCSDNEDRMLHCITKLSNLPVTVQHLQLTGVGRTVNALRKYKNGVGDAAKALVSKWKTMVANEESSECEEEDEACVPDAPESYSDSPESPHPEETIVNHRHKSAEGKHEHRHKSERNDTSSHSRHSSKHESKGRSSEANENDASKPSLSESERRKKHEKSKHKHESRSDKKSLPTDSSRSTFRKEESTDSKSWNNSESHEQSSSKSSEHKSSRGIDENHKKRRTESSPRKDSKRRKNSDDESDESKPQIALIKIKEEPMENKCERKDSSEKLKSKHKSEGSSSRSKEHDERYQSKSRKDEGHHSKKESSEKSSSSSSKSRKRDHEKSKSKGEPSDPKRKDVKVKQEFAGDEGIDCNSGTSFAEALGMCMMPHSSRKRKDNSPNIISTPKKPAEQQSSSSARKLAVVKSEPDSGDEAQGLSLLAPNVKLEPLSVDLASTLPEISPNYKPLPHINPLHRKDEDKALSDVIYVKNQRTKVYSGNKTGYTSVPTLFEICVRVLIENIDALEFTGGVPYDIIKPILERATPEQLFMLEHYNPYLIEDTDPLWQFHCSRKFRNKQREEMESWREMYMRCLDEDEAKLKAITANIKQSADKALPVRSTKLAYVDNVVKPPRNVLRQQAKYGTANALPTSSSSLKKKLIAGGGPTAATNISVPPPPMARIKTSTAVVKKTKAPLMAKALQLIKGRYKR